MKSLKETFKPDSRYLIFFLSILIMGLGYGLHKGTIDNYLAEIVQMGEFDRGLLEFFRELPGLMLIFILAALYMFSAETMLKIGAVICIIGMGMLSLVSPGKVMVTLAICMYSLGEHIQLGMKNTIALTYAKPGKGGSALGFMGSVSQIGTLAGYVVIIVAFLIIPQNIKNFKIIFLIAAVLTTIAASLTFFIRGNSKRDSSKERFYFRKKFFKYYMLEIFYGARKQVFFTFGPYVLILFYGAKATTISMLYAITAISCFFLSPIVGKIIDKLGYKIVMISDTLILVIVCFFYGFAHHIFPRDVAFIICCANYVLDSIISMASMASNVYVQDISDNDEEMKATISTGISVNHLITILIALFGGLIWQKLGIEILFILSAILGLANSAYAATIKVPKRIKA